MKYVDTLKRSYALKPDWQQQKLARQNRGALVFLWLIGLLVIAYMLWYGHQTDKAVKIMNQPMGYANDVSGVMYPNPI